MATWRIKVMGLLPMACTSPTLVLLTISVALMTSGPLTAYSIFLMQGFMFSKRSVCGATVADAEDILRRESAILLMLLLLKAIIILGEALNTVTCEMFSLQKYRQNLLLLRYNLEEECELQNRAEFWYILDGSQLLKAHLKQLYTGGRRKVLNNNQSIALPLHWA